MSRDRLTCRHQLPKHEGVRYVHLEGLEMDSMLMIQTPSDSMMTEHVSNDLPSDLSKRMVLAKRQSSMSLEPEPCQSNLQARLARNYVLFPSLPKSWNWRYCCGVRGRRRCLVSIGRGVRARMYCLFHIPNRHPVVPCSIRRFGGRVLDRDQYLYLPGVDQSQSGHKVRTGDSYSISLEVLASCQWKYHVLDHILRPQSDTGIRNFNPDDRHGWPSAALDLGWCSFAIGHSLVGSLLNIGTERNTSIVLATTGIGRAGRRVMMTNGRFSRGGGRGRQQELGTYLNRSSDGEFERIRDEVTTESMRGHGRRKDMGSPGDLT